MIVTDIFITTKVGASETRDAFTWKLGQAIT